jgi:hypothetical protein
MIVNNSKERGRRGEGNKLESKKQKLEGKENR